MKNRVLSLALALVLLGLLPATALAVEGDMEELKAFRDETNSGDSAVSRTVEEFKAQSSFSGWDFSGVWKMSAALGQPVLRSEPEPCCHPICGASCKHTGADAHENVTWKALNQASFTGGADGGPKEGSGVVLESGQYKLAEDHYYLTEDVSLDKKIYIRDKIVDLCLSGHTLTNTASDLDNAIEVSYDATLHLCDCVGDGKITSNARFALEVKEDADSFANLYGGTVDNPTGICVETRGNLILDGATLKAGKNYVIDAQKSSTVTVKSGKVEGGGANCVQMVSDAIFTMTGGTVTHTGSGHGVLVGQSGGMISGGTIRSKNGSGICLSNTSVTLSGAPTITGGEAGIAINYDGFVTVGDDLTGSYTVFHENWNTWTGPNSKYEITETDPFAFTAASGADHSSHFTPAASMTGIAVRNSGTGGSQRVQLYKPHVWAKSWQTTAMHHWHKCVTPECTITDYAACGEAGAAYGEHNWGNYETNGLQHRKKCTVCDYGDTWAPHTWDDSHDLDCNICGYERTVPLYGTVSVTGTVKLGEKLTANLADAPQGVTLKYAWTVSGGDGTVLGTAATYTPNAGEVGKTLTVTVTTDDERYTGSLSTVTNPVAKGDQAAPVGIFTITDVAYGQEKGMIAITGDAGKLEYRLKPTDGSAPAWTTAVNSNELAAGTYEFRYRETATHNASPAAEVQVRTLAANAKSLAIAPGIEHGTVTKRRDKVNPNDPVTLAVKPDNGYELTTITAAYYDGTVEQTIIPTVKPDNAQQYTFTMPNADVTVKATFSPIVYTIDYQWEGLPDGSFSVETGPVTLAVPTRAGYTLTGWAFAENGAIIENVTAAVLMAEAAERTVKLYPIWTENVPPPGPDNGEVKGEVEVKPDTPVVDVDKEALKELAGEVRQGDTVTVKLTVEKLEDPDDKDKLETVISGDKDKVLYLDLSLVKRVNDQAPEFITDTGEKILEIVVPYDFTGKEDVSVYRKHGDAQPQSLTKADTKAEGTFQLTGSGVEGKVHIYAGKFSTYAIAYTAETSTPSRPSGGSAATTTYYTITATAGQGGVISPNGKVSVRRNGAKTFTITPNEGYVVADVLVDGKSVGAVTEYSFEKTTANHTIKVGFQKADTRPTWNPFEDVKTESWFYDSVKYVYEQGMMVGTDSTHFSPNLNTSRAMIATILWRLSGSPETKAALTYPDCVHGSWYAQAVAWGTGDGVVKGYGNGEFGPDDTITREQLAVMLWRYAGSPAAGGTLNAFADSDKAGGWAVDGLCWAVSRGILTGRGGGILDPVGQATRAEAAAMLSRFIGR